MYQPIQPIFNKGDKVIYFFKDENGLVLPKICTIESIIIGDHIVFYELKELTEVVMENELISLEEYQLLDSCEMELIDHDHIDVEPQSDHFTFTQSFNHGDQVYVEGYDEDIFTVEGVIIEIYRYESEEWIEVTYELEHNSLCIYAYEEDMTLVTDTAHMNQKQQPQYSGIDKSFNAVSSNSTECKAEIDINSLLDDYNDYITLYKMFGDKEYKELADEVIMQLKEKYCTKSSAIKN